MVGNDDATEKQYFDILSRGDFRFHLAKRQSLVIAIEGKKLMEKKTKSKKNKIRMKRFDTLMKKKSVRKKIKRMLKMKKNKITKKTSHEKINKKNK